MGLGDWVKRNKGKILGGTVGFLAGGPAGALTGYKTGGALLDRPEAPDDWEEGPGGVRYPTALRPSVGAGPSATAQGLTGGGGGTDWMDWANLGLGVVGTGAGIYGDYKAGRMADEQLEEDVRRYNEGAEFRNRAYADQTAFRDRSYGDERADIEFGRDQNRRSGMALNPLVAGLLNAGGIGDLSRRDLMDEEELRLLREGAVQMES